jgi:hypothetical protein
LELQPLYPEDQPVAEEVQEDVPNAKMRVLE